MKNKPKKTLLQYCQEYFELTREETYMLSSFEEFKTEIGSVEANEVKNEFFSNKSLRNK